VYWQVPLPRKRKVVSQPGKQSLARETGPDLTTEEAYALRRCGRWSSKPFCDAATRWPGRMASRSTAPVRPTRGRTPSWRTSMTARASPRWAGELCAHAAFCLGRARAIAKMLDDSGDPDVRSYIMGLIVGLLQRQPRTHLGADRARPAAGDLRARGGGRDGQRAVGDGAGPGGAGRRREAGEPKPGDAVPARAVGEQAALRRYAPRRSLDRRARTSSLIEAYQPIDQVSRSSTARRLRTALRARSRHPSIVVSS
jgi:CDGSH-type Zn-finger protein